jgi:hypothetical protein
LDSLCNRGLLYKVNESQDVPIYKSKYRLFLLSLHSESSSTKLPKHSYGLEKERRMQNMPVWAQTPTLISRQATVEGVSNSSNDDFSPRDLDSDTDESKSSENGYQLEGED